jgi:hypothetical protein
LGIKRVALSFSSSDAALALTDVHSLSARGVLSALALNGEQLLFGG